MSCVKAAKPSEMPFELRIRVSQKNQVLDGVQIPMGRGSYKGETGGPL